ncbi:MAG: acyl transferase [Bacteroidia bacterium]|nr:acyl transferase [Bacteroidia bacterium]
MIESPDSWSHNVVRSNLTNFNEICLQAFGWQWANNPVYRQFCLHLGITQIEQITSNKQIPYLPVELFKTQKVYAAHQNPEKVFESSGTSQSGNSRHWVRSLKLYEDVFISIFESNFGSLKGHCVLGLLPSYLERENSSLIYMVKGLMKASGHGLNGFFLYEQEALAERIRELEKKEKKYFLFGVSFALYDFASRFALEMPHAVLIETGGMKGRRKEITRDELHAHIRAGLHPGKLVSEYGMSELLSQAYSDESGLYATPPWMKISLAEINDPFSQPKPGKSGLIQVIDLANIYSCPFIRSSDLGKIHPDGRFEVLGRVDHSDTRGCSLLLAE